MPQVLARYLRESADYKKKSLQKIVNNTKVVGILGGMGPAAGAHFARMFVDACVEEMRGLRIKVNDQDFPEHWLVQAPVPDRSNALCQPADQAGQPLEAMLLAMGKLASVGVTTVAMACNTAHAWHDALQRRFPQLEVLHIVGETSRELAALGVVEVGLMATDGTYDAGLYKHAFCHEGLICHTPNPQERRKLMLGIYEGVKRGNMNLARDCFESVAQALVKRHGLSTLVLGCTEISLALKALPDRPDVKLMDPSALLARTLARRAYGT